MPLSGANDAHPPLPGSPAACVPGRLGLRRHNSSFTRSASALRRQLGVSAISQISRSTTLANMPRTMRQELGLTPRDSSASAGRSSARSSASMQDEASAVCDNSMHNTRSARACALCAICTCAARDMLYTHALQESAASKCAREEVARAALNASHNS